MKNKCIYSFLFILLLQTVFLFGQSLTPNTTGSFVYTPTGPLSSKPITVYYHIPAGNISTMPILLSFHGDERDGANYRNYWIAMANANGFMVFAPEYSEANYPGGDRYQLGNVFENGDSPSAGTYNAQNLWTFSTVDPLFDDIKVRVSGTQSSYDAWGHSGGAQFLQRFRMYLPNSKLNTAICSNAGWYTVPETGIDFPYGLDKSQLTNPNLITAFSKRLIVHLGQNDTDPNSPGLRHNATVDTQQGLMRLDRGRYFYDKSLAYAPAISSSFNWQKQEVAGVGHDPQLMATNALNFLFQSSTNSSATTILDGGFENQPNALAGGTSGVLVISPTNWTANTTGSVARTTSDNGGRTGPSSAQFGTTSTGAKTFFSPQLPGALAPNTTYQIQFFYKPTVATGTVTSSFVNLYVDNAGANPAGTAQAVAAGLSASASTTTWTKVAVSITTNTTPAGANGVVAIAFTTSGITPGFTANFDDFIIYQGNAPDIKAPNAPAAITATVAPSGGANLSWPAASGGVDGGGYVLVRYTTKVPLTSDVPIQNGIYAVNNSIGTGVVRYIGTGTSFTDTGLSSGTDYYYKVYAVDKAFNYSNESTTSSPINPSATFYYKGTGSLADLSNWGTNTNGSGTPPLNFNNNSQVFEIRNTTAVATDAPWTIGGNARVVVGASTLEAVTFTISSGFALSLGSNARLDIAPASVGNNEVIFQNASLPTLGTVDVSANISYANGVAGLAITNLPCNTFKITNNTAVSLDNTPSCKFLVVDAGSLITSGTTNVITIASGGNVTINGTFAGNRSKGIFTKGLVASADRGNIHSDDTNTTISLGTNSKIIYSRTSSAQSIAPLVYADLEIRCPSVVLTTDITVNKDLTLTSSAVVILNSGLNLTVTNAIINNGTLTIQNNANLVQVTDNVANTGSGNTTVQRNSNPLLRLDYTLWSSPVLEQSLTAFSPLTSQDPSRFYSFDTTFNTGGVNGAFAAIENPGLGIANFIPGAGYLIRMPNTVSESMSAAYVGVFTGTPNNGAITVPLIDGLSAGLRYNLIGNPYPSPISIATLISDNTTKIETTLFFWRKTNGLGSAYCTYNTTGPVFTTNGNIQSVDPAGVIQTGQGFFVEAKSGVTSLTFKNGQRVANTAGQFFKTKPMVASSRIWLNATTTAGAFSQMALNYADGATLGVDDYDSKYINDNAFALTSNVSNGEYTIQGRPAFDANDIVALNFKTSAAGDYTIAIDHTEGVFASGQDIYLVDIKTGVETNLKTGAYNFTAAAGVDNSRFSLKYQKTLKIDSSALSDTSVQVYKNKGTLYVNSAAKTIKAIQVYDIQGRLIAQQMNVKATKAVINNLRADHQVLIVKIEGEDNSVVTKKLLN